VLFLLYLLFLLPDIGHGRAPPALIQPFFYFFYFFYSRFALRPTRHSGARCPLDRSQRAAAFFITITNTGNITLTAVTLTDGEAPDCDNVLAELGPGLSVAWGCTLAGVTESFTNTALVTATAFISGSVKGFDDAYVEASPPTAVGLVGLAGAAQAAQAALPALLALGMATGALLLRRRRS
jgi:hypothetical protein